MLRTLSSYLKDVQQIHNKFTNPEFWTKFRRDCPYFWSIGSVDEASMPKTSSIRPVVSIQYRLVTDRWTHTQTHDDSIYHANIASCSKNWLSKHNRVVKRWPLIQMLICAFNLYNSLWKKFPESHLVVNRSSCMTAWPETAWINALIWQDIS